jgi:hypothetical protein
MLAVPLVFGLLCAPIAAAMAFLITYQEYQHHGFDRRTLLRRCLGAAATAFAFFAVGAVALSWVLGRMLGLS